MAGLFVAIAIFAAEAMSAAQEERDEPRKDRSSDLSRSILNISQRVRDIYETAKGLLPQDDASLLIWKETISEQSIKTTTGAIRGFENAALPVISVSEINIPELYYRRFLLRKIELELQGLLPCIKAARLAVSGPSTVLSTYDDLAKSGAITQSQAEDAKQKFFSQHTKVELQAPSVPSNQAIFEEFREKDLIAHAYTNEDPSFEAVLQWLASTSELVTEAR